MSAVIGYKVEIENIDPTLDKLREMRNLLNDISSKGGLSNLQNFVNNSNSGNSGNNGVGVQKVAEGTIVGDVIAAGVQGNIVGDKTSKAIENEFSKMEKWFHKGNEINDPNSTGTRFGTQSALDAFNKNHPNFSGSKLDRDTTSEDNKYRILGVDLSKINSIKSGFKELELALGPVGIGLAITVVGITAFVAGLKILNDVIKESVDLFKAAAGQGVNNRSESQISNAFKQLGLSAPDLTRYGRSFNGDSQHDTSTALGLSQSGQLGQEAKSLVNMATEFSIAMQLGAQDAREMSKVIGVNYATSLATGEITREWNTLVAQTAAALQPFIISVVGFTDVILKLLNLLMEGIVWLENKLGFQIDATNPGGNAQITPTGNNIAQGNSWENMGLIMGLPSLKSTDYLREIAHNTSIMANKTDSRTNSEKVKSFQKTHPLWPMPMLA